MTEIDLGFGQAAEIRRALEDDRAKAATWLARELGKLAEGKTPWLERPLREVLRVVDGLRTGEHAK